MFHHEVKVVVVALEGAVEFHKGRVIQLEQSVNFPEHCLGFTILRINKNRGAGYLDNKGL